MKLFEIGDGLKSIEVSDRYYSDWEDEGQTVILYTAENDDIEIRISVLSVTPKEESDADKVFNYVIQRGEKEGYPVKIAKEKSFYQYTVESEEESIVTFHYMVGYEWSYIIFSVTTSQERRSDPEIVRTLEEVEQMVVTITEVDPEKATIFEPKYSDYKEIYERVSQILGIKEVEIDDFHQDNKTLSLLQAVLDEEEFGAEETYELQSMGLALGDYIQYKERDFRWAIIRDEYGRDLCLQNQRFSITLFPMSWIEKRVKEGEEVWVKGFVEALFEKIEEVVDEDEEGENNSESGE